MESKKFQEKLLELFKLIPDLFFLVSGDTTILNYGGREEELYIPPKEFLGKKMKDILPKDIGTLSFNSIKRAIKTQKLQILQYSLPIKDKLLYFEARHLYFSEDRVAIFIRNITDQKHLEEKFMKAFQSNPSLMAISTIDDGIFIDVNDSFLNALGYQREEVIGKKSADLNIWDDIEQRKAAIKEVKEKGQIRNLTVKIRTKNGVILYGLFSVEIIQVQDKSYLLTIMNDITELIKTEQKLKESERNLKLLNKELEQRIVERTKELKKSEEKYRKAYNNANFFKDLITHDMNNVLQSIISSIELISISQNQPNLHEKTSQYHDIIKKSAFRGSKLISNVQKIAKIEDNEIILENIDINKFLSKSISYVKNSFQNRYINIQIEPHFDKLHVKANDFLSDVFENILINAIIYNKNLQVNITIRISMRKEKEKNFVIFEFIDNGMGVEDSRKELLFEKGLKKEKQSKGMGIGLSLVKKIIKSYDGKIWVEDKIKGDHLKGSKFIIMIPKI